MNKVNDVQSYLYRSFYKHLDFTMQYLKLINTFMPYFFSSISRINSFIMQFSILEQGKKKRKRKDILSRTFYFQNKQTSIQ